MKNKYFSETAAFQGYPMSTTVCMAQRADRPKNGVYVKLYVKILKQFSLFASI